MNNYELKVFMSSLPSPWPVKQSDMPCGAQDLNTRMISLQSNSSQRDTGLTMTPQQASDPSGENVSAMLPMLPMLHENPNYKRAPEKRSNPVSEYKIRLYVTLSQPQDNCMSEPLSQGTKKVKQHIKAFFIHTCLTTCPNKIQTA